MDGAQFAKMLSDKHLFELNRMEYKYSTVSVKEFAELLRQNFAQPLPLTDFSGNKLFYLPNLAQISTNGMKQLLSVPISGQNFGLSAMTEEIYATFQIESIRSTRSSIRYILDGYAPRDEQEARIYGMKRGLEFIANRQNRITEENLHHLYQISTGDYLPDEDRLLPNHFYRHGEVFIVGGEEPRPGLPAERLPGAMKCLVDFANANDGINELHKAAILHFAFAYYHPYFDGNGRTARLFHLWYLVQQGYPAVLFTPFSRYIAENKGAYYKAYERVERNALISGYTDVTPFLFYFCNEVYNRLQVDAVPPKTDLEVYQTALAEGKITEKERLLWEYVLSAYGAEEFTTKQLEKDFRNAAYATIRTFVMKFHDIRRKENNGKRPVVQLDAHSDEVGFMVQAICPNGTLRIIQIGGWVNHNIPAHKVWVRNRFGEYIPGITASKPPHFMTEQERKAPLDMKDITVDVGAVSKEEAMEKFGIRIGEPVVPDVTFTYSETTDLMVGKSFDCRLGCAAILKTMHNLAGQELNVDIVGACAAQEEVGVRGATVTAQVIKPDIAIVFEGCPADDTCVEPYMVQTAIKRGPMLRHIDARMITNPRYQRYALDLAEKLGIPVQDAVRSAGATNGAAIHLTEKAVPVIVIGVPVRYAHTHYGISAYADFDNAVKLACEILKRLDEEQIRSF